MQLVRKNEEQQVQGLLAHLEEAEAALAKAEHTVEQIRLELARLTCPFSVGETVYTDSSFGKQGLVVEEIRALEEPHGDAPNDWWQLVTKALNARGEKTNRVLLVAAFQKPRGGK